MKRVQPDLWATLPERRGAGHYTHAYLLQQDAGNILFYHTRHRDQITQLARLGGVTRQYLSHQGEVDLSLALIATHFGAELGGHVHEQRAFIGYRHPTILLHKRDTHRGNIEVIPTPGHSPGSTCFYTTGAQGKRYLFTGTTLWLSRGRTLKTAFSAGSSDLDAYLKSLDILSGLSPDVVLTSATDGHGGVLDVTPERWAQQLAGARTQLLARR